MEIMQIIQTAGWEDYSVWVIPLVIAANLIYKTVSNYKKQETADAHRDASNIPPSEKPPTFFEQLEKTIDQKLEEAQQTFSDTFEEKESTLDNREQELYAPRAEKERPFMFKGEQAYPIKEGYKPVELAKPQPLTRSTKTTAINEKYRLNSTSRLKQAVIWSEILRPKYQEVR